MSWYSSQKIITVHIHLDYTLPWISVKVLVYNGCPKKRRMLDFRYFDVRKCIYLMLMSSDKTLSSEKNHTKIILIWFGSFDSTTFFFLNTYSHLRIMFNLRELFIRRV